jgi:beta-1,4-N-acetylglucosaminyltransferase
MIFVTVGNDFRGFDRLLREIDAIAPRIPTKILIQRGYSRYLPKNAEHFDFVPMDRALDYMRHSELVVSHAGIGTIILCKEYGIPILLFPRRKACGEHMNDHQLEIARALESREAEHIHVVYEENQLEETILKIMKRQETLVPVRPPGKTSLLKTIKAFIDTV